MEQHSQVLSFLVEFLKFCIALFVAGFGYNKYIQSQIQGVYKRMDDNKKQYYQEFVSKQVHDLEIKHQSEKTDEKFKSMIEIFRMDRDHLEQKADDKIKSITEIFAVKIDALTAVYLQDTRSMPRQGVVTVARR